MSLVDAFHAEHLARLARMGGRSSFATTAKPLREKPSSKPVVSRYAFDPSDERAWMIAIEGLIPIEPETFTPSLYVVRRVVCEHFGVALKDFLGPRRDQALSYPRHVACYLASKLTLQSYPEIGRKFGGKDHTTIMHGYRKIAMRMLTDMHTAASVEYLSRQLNGTDVSAKRRSYKVLSRAAATAIRNSGKPSRFLAAEYGVSVSSIDGIRAGRRWKVLE